MFNFNYAQAKAATGSFSEAEDVFLLINSEAIRNDYVYLSWLARCCELITFISVRQTKYFKDLKFANTANDTSLPAVIMNKKPQQAWELYLKMETSADSFSLLQLIANDCYKVPHHFSPALK